LLKTLWKRLREKKSTNSRIKFRHDFFHNIFALRARFNLLTLFYKFNISFYTFLMEVVQAKKKADTLRLIVCIHVVFMNWNIIGNTRAVCSRSKSLTFVFYFNLCLKNKPPTGRPFKPFRVQKKYKKKISSLPLERDFCGIRKLRLVDTHNHLVVICYLLPAFKVVNLLQSNRWHTNNLIYISTSFWKKIKKSFFEAFKFKIDR
jgi:hypothetical protein